LQKARCKCGHLYLEAHPAKYDVDETTAIKVTHPCAVMICDCEEAVSDETGKAKPR